MEVVGKGAVTVLDGSRVQTDAHQAKGHRPIMVSGAVVHSLPDGSWFDLRGRELLAGPRAWNARPRSERQADPLASGPPAGEGAGRGAPARARPHGRRDPGVPGPEHWSYDPAIRLLVDLGALEDWPSNTIPGFVGGLLEMLPGIAEHSCSLGRRGGFGERLKEGTWLGHVAEHIALELQRESGAHVYRGKTRSAGEAGRYNVIYGYWEERVGLAAGELAVRLVNHLVRRRRGSTSSSSSSA